MKSSRVNYDTQWTHDYFRPNQALYFKANTPVDEIVFRLGKEMGKLFPRFEEDYQTRSIRLPFNRLYRNVIKSYKGWQILYRKPGSSQAYGPISEPIGYKPRAPKQSLQQNVLKKTLRWTHELYPLIGKVETSNAVNCKAIAEQLNQKIAQPCYDKFFFRSQRYLVDLVKIHKRCNPNQANFYNIIAFWYKLQGIAQYYRPMHFLNSKDYRVQASNISDVLKETTSVKTAKGWRVKMVDN